MQCFPLILLQYKINWVGPQTHKKRLRFSKLSNVCIMPSAASTKNFQKTVLTRARFTIKTFFHSPLAGACCLASPSTLIQSRNIWRDQIGSNMTKRPNMTKLSMFLCLLQLSRQPTEIRCCHKRCLQLEDAKTSRRGDNRASVLNVLKKHVDFAKAKLLIHSPK